jgi:FAD/FMN-containing dehydrogenase
VPTRTLIRTVEHLRNQIAGQVVAPGDSGYDSARTIWNATIDRFPAVIVRCAATADVPTSIGFARDNELELAVRGGGHNIAGNAMCDAGVVIDLSLLTDVAVDATNRRAHVQPGATLAHLDAATQAHALAMPLGINSTTGVAGLTLGGGFGWLTRKYGLTIDSLVSARIVTADGKTFETNERERPDLFWAIRGGGGNFGVVTQFDFALHPLDPMILSGLVVFPIDQAIDVMQQYRTVVDAAPEELSIWAVLRHAPPLPFLPPVATGHKVLILAACYAGAPAEGRAYVDALQDLGDPLGAHIDSMSYVAWQQAFDPLLTAGARNYWKTHNFTELSEEAIRSMVEFAGRMPSSRCEIFLASVAGALNRVPADRTAYAHRDAKFVLNVHARWEGAGADHACIEWARAFFDASAPFASSGAYVNFMTGDESDRVSAAYGPNYDRLVEIKRKYDPRNVFHYNQNIKP